MTFDAARDHWEFFRAQTGAVLEKAGNRRMSALEQLQQNVAEEQKKLRAERPTIVLGVPGYGLGHDGFWAGFLAHASDNKEVDVARIKFTNSLLGRSFNHVYAEAIYAAETNPNVTHFAMLHTDVSPGRYWLDVLWEECQRLQADILSVVIPIKSPEGLTSTAIDNPEDSWQPKRRLTMTEVMGLPETFDASDLVKAGFNPDNDLLLVNTGCMIVDIRKDWTHALDENDCLRCYFTVDDRVQKQEDKKYCVSVIPEDWNFCRSACSVDPDVRIFATRKVRIEHRGDASYCNDQAWGAWTYDRESLGVQPELEEQEEEQRIAG